MGEQNHNLILFEGSPLERIAASAVVPRNVLVDLVHSRFFLANEIVMGNYGVAGFLIIDTRPEERWESYSDSGLYYVGHSLKHCIHIPEEVRENPFRLAHYINTDKGFKMIRYFLIPNRVRTFLERDEDLCDGFINKCCKTKEVIPKDFDEEKAYEVFDGYRGNDEGNKLIDGVIEGIAPRLRQIGELKFERYKFRHECYLSFHAWQFYQQCLRTGEESIVATISRFDNMLLIIDKKGALKNRNLGNSAYEHSLQLPSTQ